MIIVLIKKALQILVSSPFYPHWLEFLKLDSGNDYVLKKYSSGDVLEVGAGTGDRSIRNKTLLKDQIDSYVMTDFDTWDEEFENKNKRSEDRYGFKSIFYSYNKNREKMDFICSAINLPFKNESFDVHLSFETLEHIEDPFKYFSEASRVLRKNGKIILCAPFLYRMHGGEPDHNHDFHRYVYGFYYTVAKKNNLKILEIYSNTGIGTSSAVLWNQYLIRKVAESNRILSVFLLCISPFVFLINNLVGYLIDINSDKRFATRYHVVMQK